MKKKVYICGPISGYNLHERQNAFRRCENDLEQAGFTVLNPLSPPASVNRHPAFKSLEPGGPEHKVWAAWICALLPALGSCDYVYYLDGWEKSPGCQIEHIYAKRLLIPHYPTGAMKANAARPPPNAPPPMAQESR